MQLYFISPNTILVFPRPTLHSVDQIKTRSVLLTALNTTVLFNLCFILKPDYTRDTESACLVMAKIDSVCEVTRTRRLW